MPFLQHLEELRQTLIRIIIAVAVGAAIAWSFTGRILTWLIESTTAKAIFLKPQGAFIARLKVAIVLGILLTLPYIFWKIWSFVGPGLLDRERKVVLPGVVSSVVLFYLGISFSYFIMTPLMVKVLIGFATLNLAPQIEVSSLLDMVFAMGLACGLIFQLPLFSAFLTSIGILKPRFFKRFWRHSVVVIFVTSAILTPADPISQVALAVPLLILFILSYFVSSTVYKGKRATRAREAREERRRQSESEETEEPEPPEE
jgi:sec-independent protein translocase protein TatC